MAKIICCDECKSINVEEIDTDFVETGHYYKETYSYPWKEEKVIEYDKYKIYKCKECGFNFKEKC